MKIVVDLRDAAPIEVALARAFPDAFRIVVGFGAATVLDDREGWQEARFSKELAAIVRARTRGERDWKYLPAMVPEAQEFTVQIVRRGRGPRRSGRGKYPA